MVLNQTGRARTLQELDMPSTSKLEGVIIKEVCRALNWILSDLFADTYWRVGEILSELVM